MIQVVVIDDHPSLRLGVSELLRDAGIEVVGEAATARDGMAVVEAASPDVAIIDLQLPDESGAVLCRSIKARWPSVACLVHSAGADLAVIADAIEAGASGYVSKGSPSAVLIDAVTALASGREAFPPELTDQLVDTFRARARGGPVEELTEEENNVLNLLAEGLSNREISERSGLAEKTVRNNMSKLFQKLGLRDRTQAALYAQRRRA